jgi:hypothetical protein
MRPIDFCTPKPFQLEHSCSVASQRSDRTPCDAFQRSPEGHSRPGALRLRARPRERLLRVLLRPSEDARSRHREARGRPMQTRLGRTALHGAFPTSAPGRSCARAFSSFVRESSPFASDTLVASSVSRWPGPVLPGSHAVARRPPRPVPRGPRERRAHSRSRVPSIVSRYAHPGRAEARTKPRRLHQRRGAHVMRIAEL